MNTKLLYILLTASIAFNIFLGWRFSEIAKELAQKEQAVQVIENNYYSLFNKVNNYFDAVSKNAERQGFFNKLFGSDSSTPKLDISEFEDPYANHD